jgi:hypothetical protein
MAYTPTQAQAAYYRAEAAKARSRAEAMSDYQARQLMLQSATTWEAMAEVAETPSRSIRRTT